MDVDVMTTGDAVQFEAARCQQGLEILEADVRMVARAQSEEELAWTTARPTLSAACPATRGIPTEPVAHRGVKGQCTHVGASRRQRMGIS